jgi:hypothetical protein
MVPSFIASGVGCSPFGAIWTNRIASLCGPGRLQGDSRSRGRPGRVKINRPAKENLVAREELLSD